MQQWLNYRVRVVLHDGRELLGQFMAYDKHMNVVLGDADEFRRLKAKPSAGKEERIVKRALGLVLLRGEVIVSLSVEGPPPAEHARSRVAALAGGPGVGRAAGRGLAVPPPGMMGQPMMAPPVLAGAPVRGLGGPAPPTMQPRPPGGLPGMPHVPPGFVPPPGFAPPPFARGGPLPGFGGPPPGFVPPPGMGPPPGFPGGPPPFARGAPPPGFPPQ